MSRLKKLGVLLGVVVVLALAGLVFLAMWDPPAPTQEVNKTLSDDAFIE